MYVHLHFYSFYVMNLNMYEAGAWISDIHSEMYDLLLFLLVCTYISSFRY